jgi:membrane fusion protein (multidrug efflux system)
MPIARSLLVCLVSSLLFACDDPQDATGTTAAAPPPAVVVTPAVSRAVSTAPEFIGQTEAYQSVDLRARVTGFLTEKHFEEGGQIAKDDVLFVIDPAQFNAARDAAAARVQRAEATIAEGVRRTP